MVTTPVSVFVNVYSAQARKGYVYRFSIQASLPNNAELTYYTLIPLFPYTYQTNNINLTLA
jgi:hypothetical protein